MPDNKTRPTKVKVEDFLAKSSEQRQQEAAKLIEVMSEISAERPVMWGPSIIGFGSMHYKHDTGREGDMPKLSFSPRKSAITIYFNDGFNKYAKQLEKLGKHKASISCLYINKLSDIDTAVLSSMLRESYRSGNTQRQKPATVEQYVGKIPRAARTKFSELRKLAKKELPNAEEVLSYGIIGYKINDKRARVYISAWKDHLAIYPVPKDKMLRTKLKPYIKGRGTIWLPLEEPLPTKLISETVKVLADDTLGG